MLIAISGSQGSGKTTLINELKSLGYPTIERKTARSILDDWSVTLDIVNADFDLKKAFQEELIRRKYNDEVQASLSDELWITERTFADLFTYALISFGQYNEYDEWLDKYYQTCLENSQVYKNVFYITAQFNIEQDGIRSVNRHYSRMIDKIMLDITKQMIYDEKVSIIDIEDLSERTKIITNKIKEIEL